MKILGELYAGKAKTVLRTDDPDALVLRFRDDATAFDGVKHARLPGKGTVNNKVNAFVMERLERGGIPTHFIRLLSDHESLVRRLDMIPVECVVRNLAAGSLCKRLGVEEGRELDPPVFEFFLKNDELHDPMINESHIRTFRWATEEEVARMKALTLQANAILKPLFQEAGLLLVDYKLEFGRFHGQVLLGDEFTPDGCRLWDAESRRKLDKDLFRHDLGDLMQAYHEVAHRLGVPL